MAYRILTCFALLCLTHFTSFKLQAITELDLLITGCARSGTAYIARVLDTCEFDFKHEAIGEYGISSWVMAVPSDETPWGPAGNSYQFLHVFHQVRDPLKTISSVYTTEGVKSWSFITKHIPQISLDDNHIVRSAKYWFYWNLRAEAKAEWTYKVEDLDNLRTEFEKRLGEEIDPVKWTSIPKDANQRSLKSPRRGYIESDKATEFTWADLKKELDPELYNNIRSLALKYGYSVN